jgi:hypothetical protein
MFPSLQLTLSVALLLGCDFVSAQARSGGAPPEDRWKPQHIGGLRAEIREAIAPYARVCGASLAAEHSFARYPKGTTKLLAFISNTSSAAIGPPCARPPVACIRSTFRPAANTGF